MKIALFIVKQLHAKCENRKCFLSINPFHYTNFLNILNFSKCIVKPVIDIFVNFESKVTSSTEDLNLLILGRLSTK